MPVVKILVKIYDQSGHRVEELIEQELPSGGPNTNYRREAQEIAGLLYRDRRAELMQRQPFRCYACGKDPISEAGSSHPFDFDSNYPGTSCVYHVLPHYLDGDCGCLKRIVGDINFYKRPGRDCDSADKAGKICYTCGEVAELKKCNQCQRAKYCSKHCQRLDWSAHRKECQYIAMCNMQQAASASNLRIIV